ncbi:Malto-oligosyltrehalose trehalohydrolase [Metallosphaera sp. J1]|nr:Malto-oligosyltrehalose trehalohydrolase [Metallosphaera javensis (ex Hofmann et al. 2022)]
MFGPLIEEDGVNFSLWAPYCSRASLKLGQEIIPMDRDEMGYFRVKAEAKPGDKYKFVTDRGEIPDPASRFQPDGVHGYSQLVSPLFPWEDQEWKGLRKEDLIIYEIHVGTFTSEGTFEGVTHRLDYLSDLGITALEIMPVAQFPGKRGWGYDGVYLYAVQNSYGGPSGLKKLVNEAHKRNLGVILDVVYNHVGPEGNYMNAIGPYFSTKYKTPWGLTFNYDDYGSDEVRRFVLENLEYWMTEFHIDGFRLDAVHAIIDNSPKHILEEIADVVHRHGKLVIAESDLNDPRIVNPKERCGYGIDAQWVDDFHHSIHAYLTGERQGYYSDYGSLEDVIKAFRDVFVYDGRYSRFRGKTHGRPVDLDGCSFVVYIQNHDQVGNRGKGERLSTLLDRESLKMAAALYLLSPYIPMIFMGEEYGETTPFYYFSDFSDPELIKGVREGRKRENGQEMDPQSETAFNSSKLTWKINEEIHRLYKELIAIRKKYVNCDRKLEINSRDSLITIKKGALFMIFAFKEDEIKVNTSGKILISSGSFPHKIHDGVIRVDKGFAVYLEETEQQSR